MLFSIYYLLLKFHSLISHVVNHGNFFYVKNNWRLANKKLIDLSVTSSWTSNFHIGWNFWKIYFMSSILFSRTQVIMSSTYLKKNVTGNVIFVKQCSSRFSIITARTGESGVPNVCWYNWSLKENEHFSLIMAQPSKKSLLKSSINFFNLWPFFMLMVLTKLTHITELQILIYENISELT